MPDPLSITTDATDTAATCLLHARDLVVDLGKLDKAPESVKRLRNDAYSVELALTSFQSVREADWQALDMNIAEQIQIMIESCTETCTWFREKLQHWMKLSTDKPMTVQDRMNLTFRQTEIEVMSEKLRDCRLSVTSAVSTATLYSSIRNSQATADIQSAVFETQKTLQSAAGFSDNQATRLAVTLQQLQLDSGIDTRIDGTSYTELVTRLEEECKAAEATRTLLNRLYAKTHEEAIAKAIAESQNHSTHATSGDNNTGFQSEVVNDGV